MTLVLAVQVTVVDIVHVVLVRHGHVTAPVTVLVRVPLVDGVAPHGALVPVTVVPVVQVTVVDIVHVALVRHRDVPAPVTVLVRVPLVNGMLCGHLSPSKKTSGKKREHIQDYSIGDRASSAAGAAHGEFIRFPPEFRAEPPKK
ncbi:hypothetical protein ACF07Q_05235 [Nocardiopsis dassonvillei]|uniref:hypothetical protein n=1 Tax=Nocardiopsis dassonvillei TaxID=2014 RepID=UPI0036FDEBC1